MTSNFGCNLECRYGPIELGGSNHSFVGASDIIWVYFRNSKIKLSVFKSFTISYRTAFLSLSLRIFVVVLLNVIYLCIRTVVNVYYVVRSSIISSLHHYFPKVCPVRSLHWKWSGIFP